jgi:hypothetical protein
LVEKYKAEGIREGSAMLKASDDLEEMGLIAKSPKIVATSVAGVPVGGASFTISSSEFRFGMFQDIEKAIKAPGKEIDFWGRYVRHTDYTTSERLNDYLDDWRVKEFYVVTGGVTYRMELRYRG